MGNNGNVKKIFLACISKKADEHSITNTPNHTTPEFYAQSSKYHPKDLGEDLPPLPSRSQFLTSSPDKSYENLSELPGYVKEDEKAPPPLYYHTETLACQEDPHECDNISEDYDDIDVEEDYDDVG
ncbi:hypothetical protein DPEC_G00224360 [Dallia pectoralis]|uniref:Uncharacterized protein n=1 Tax=Dallia pectoralis TaxID=75939 RepID=A0ACC2FZU7_DALPE|nr:hypothetical protein DPEC_G00224360 [Dallia pectoralis]